MSCWQLQRKLDVGFPLHRLLIFYRFITLFTLSLDFTLRLLWILNLVWIFCFGLFVHLCLLAFTCQESVVNEVSNEKPNTCQNHNGSTAEIHVLVAFSDVDQFPCKTVQRFEILIFSVIRNDDFLPSE